MDRRRIAIGIDNFKDIIDYNYFYIDKTKFIEEVCQNFKKSFLFTRPRRFGKSLNMSMLKYFFDIENKEENRKLFNGLYIENSDCMREQGQYPVISISFKMVKSTDIDELYDDLRILFSRLYGEYIFLLEHLEAYEKVLFNEILTQKVNKNNLKTALYDLTFYLHRYYGKKVIILIDEYDTPLIVAYQNDYYKEVINFFKTMYGDVLKSNNFIQMGILTGIVRVAQAEIFSDLNNLDIYTILQKDYEEFFGFTESEVRDALIEFGVIDKFKEVKYWYNGYKFGDMEIYNPWSILKYLQNDEFKAYWVNTSSNNAVIEMIRKSDSNIMQTLEDLLEDKEAMGIITEQVNLTERLTANEIWEFLLFAGYTKVVEQLENGLYTFAIPNHEVKTMFKTLFLDVVFDNKTSIIELNLGLRTKDLRRIKTSIENLLLHATSYWDLNNATENKYQLLLSGFLYGLEGNFIISVNREVGDGRADIVLEPINSKTGYIFELKLKTNKEDPISQINEKRYDAELKRKGVMDIVKLGMIFDGKRVEFVER